MPGRLIDTNILVYAIDLVSQHSIHLWDAAIAAAMKENDVSEIVTENVKDFRKISGLNVSCPF